MEGNIILKPPQIRQVIIPSGRGNRPGPWPGGDYDFVTVHETDNEAATATAAMHAQYLLGDEAAGKPVSWHFTCDDTEVIQHLPLTEHGWHAGDGPKGPGNLRSVGVEVCVNKGGNLFLAYLLAAWIIAGLLKCRGLNLDRLRTHNWWSGKDCPRRLRANKAGPMGWEWFMGMVWLQMSGQSGDAEQLRRQVAELQGRLQQIRVLTTSE
ncbi:MAG: N-acetylmuramoyl-L-alanine amidase family protein [bacterium]|jgi:N-acetylmuramoyl-L-alanine amidase